MDRSPGAIGLVHDYLLVLRGAERTFASLADCWADAPVYTLLYDEEGTQGRFSQHEVISSFLQRTGVGQDGFRKLLPLYPLAVERLKVSPHRVVVSSSSAFAHGVRSHPGAVHVCYCHSPFRYAWFERRRALAEVPRPVRPALAGLLSALRRWDRRAARRVTRYIANSQQTRRRIRKLYGVDAPVVHPPVEVDRFHRDEEPQDYFLTVGEVVPHKQVELAAEAAVRARQPLKVVGSGPDLGRLRERYGRWVQFLGRVEDEELQKLYARARALVVPNVEEFGIAAVEAQAAGRPVIGVRAGGVVETVVEDETGTFVEPGNVEDMARTLRDFDDDQFDPEAIQEHSRRFSDSAFRDRMRTEVEAVASDAAPPHFAASAGGHLDLLMNVARRTVGSKEVPWVTSSSDRGEALRREGHAVTLLPEHGRNPVQLARNAGAAFSVVRRTRPHTVVTSGAGVVAPYCLFARLSGAKLIYLETMARVTTPSMTARILSRFASKVIVQWDELRDALPGAEVCRPTLLEAVNDTPASPGRGTFVAVGTHAQPYGRLLHMVEDAARRGVLPQPVRVQKGVAEHWNATGIDSVQWLTQPELEAALKDAELVICHAGAGIIASALRAGRKPMVLPRRPELEEHIDDHQQQLARKLASWDVVVLLEHEIGEGHVDAARRPPKMPEDVTSAPSAAELVGAELVVSPV